MFQSAVTVVRYCSFHKQGDPSVDLNIPPKGINNFGDHHVPGVSDAWARRGHVCGVGEAFPALRAGFHTTSYEEGSGICCLSRCGGLALLRKPMFMISKRMFTMYVVSSIADCKVDTAEFPEASEILQEGFRV